MTIRNPQLIPPAELSSGADEVQIGPDGQPVMDAEVTKATYRIGARLIIGMRVYDPTVPVELDEHGELIPGDAPLLPTRPEPDDVAKLPMAIITWLGEEMGKVNPQQTPESPGATGRTS